VAQQSIFILWNIVLAREVCKASLKIYESNVWGIIALKKEAYPH
jgi:hypothetical protein